MKIVGLQGISGGELNFELQRGAKFVSYQYCISLIIITLKCFSDIYFVRAGERDLGSNAGYCAISLVLGWWGIPWGPIYTIGSLITNFKGAKNLTQEVVASLNKSAQLQPPSPQQNPKT